MLESTSARDDLAAALSSWEQRTGADVTSDGETGLRLLSCLS